MFRKSIFICSVALALVFVGAYILNAQMTADSAQDQNADTQAQAMSVSPVSQEDASAANLSEAAAGNTGDQISIEQMMGEEPKDVGQVAQQDEDLQAMIAGQQAGAEENQTTEVTSEDEEQAVEEMPAQEQEASVEVMSTPAVEKDLSQVEEKAMAVAEVPATVINVDASAAALKPAEASAAMSMPEDVSDEEWLDEFEPMVNEKKKCGCTINHE